MVGHELTDAALTVLSEVERRVGGFHLAIEHHEGGAEYYRRHGYNLSNQSLQAIQQADAMMKGPAGLPDVRREDGTEAGSLGGVLRVGLDVYANVRPIRLLPKKLDWIVTRSQTPGGEARLTRRLMPQ